MLREKRELKAEKKQLARDRKAAEARGEAFPPEPVAEEGAGDPLPIVEG